MAGLAQAVTVAGSPVTAGTEVRSGDRGVCNLSHGFGLEHEKVHYVLTVRLVDSSEKV